MLSQDEARARVAKGATHLDTVRPGWQDRIDVGTLTLHDPCGCIVGQLGNYEGIDFGTEWHLLFAHGGLNGEECGCFTDDCGELVAIYQPLQDAWIEAIADRRLAAQQQTEAEVPACVR